jgi:Putative zinc-finger
MTGPDPFEHDDAAYVMGLLSDDDRVAFESHLTTCNACRERVAELRPTAGLLSAIGSEDLLDALGADAPAGPMPETLLPGLLRRAGVRRRRERWLTTAVSGLAVASLVALLIAVWPSSGPGAGGSNPQALKALVSTPLRATAAVTTVSWGTRISLNCDYYGAARGQGNGVSYGLTVIAKDGSRHTLGTWTVAPGRHTTFTSGTALPGSALRTIEITSQDGTAVMALNL